MHTLVNKHQWSSGRIVPCHGTDPGSIPGWCIPKLWGYLCSCDDRVYHYRLICGRIRVHLSLHFFFCFIFCQIASLPILYLYSKIKAFFAIFYFTFQMFVITYMNSCFLIRSIGSPCLALYPMMYKLILITLKKKEIKCEHKLVRLQKENFWIFKKKKT